MAENDTKWHSSRNYHNCTSYWSNIPQWAGKAHGTRDGSKAQFSQPTGICFDYGTPFAFDTLTGTVRITSSFTSLEDYLRHLHLFGETFGLHTKASTSVIVEIPQAIERLEQGYSFDKKCEPYWYHSCDTRSWGNCFICCHGRWKKDLEVSERWHQGPAGPF